MLQDLGLVDEAGESAEDSGPDADLPDDEPSVRSLYWDCYHPLSKPGYSEKPPNTRVCALDRRLYNRADAEKRFAELREKHGWKVYGQPYYTVRFWCWCVY